MSSLNNTDPSSTFELRAVSEVVFAVQAAIHKDHPRYARMLEAVGERLQDIDYELKNSKTTNQN